MSETDQARAAEEDEATEAAAKAGREVAEAAAEVAEPAPTEPAPEAPVRHVTRQWVSLPGGSIDARVGAGAVEEIGTVLKNAVGKPRVAALVVDPATPADLAEHLQRDLADAGYRAALSELPVSGDCHTLEALGRLLEAFGACGLTADDLVVAVAGYDGLSLASIASRVWCGGVALVGVPLDLRALIDAPLTPRPLDVGDLPRMVSVRPGFRHLVCDPDRMDLSPEGEDARMARALMAATAVAESQKAFEHLFDQAVDLAAGDADALVDQAMATLKARGHLVSSTVLAVRQSIAYGQDVASALAPLAPGLPYSTLLSGALRFAARLSAGQGKLKVDDVLTQDELLDRLGLPDVTGSFDPDEVISALKAERFLRTNRFMVEAPESFGRVRLMTVDDDLLREHVGAWCATRER